MSYHYKDHNEFNHYRIEAQYSITFFQNPVTECDAVLTILHTIIREQPFKGVEKLVHFLRSSHEWEPLPLSRRSHGCESVISNLLV